MIVEVPIEKIIEVPVTIEVIRPVFKEILIEEEVDIETNPIELYEGEIE